MFTNGLSATMAELSACVHGISWNRGAPAQQSAFGDDAYQSIASKAAAYGYFIALGSAFSRWEQTYGCGKHARISNLNGFALDHTANLSEGHAGERP